MQFIKNSIFTELGWKLHILPFRLVFLVFLDQGCSKVWKSMEKGFGWSDNVVGIVWLISLVGLQNFLGGGRGNQNPLPPGSYSPAHYATYVRVIARGGRGYRGPEPPGLWQIIWPYSNYGGQIMPVTLLPAPRMKNAIYTSVHFTASVFPV